MSKTNASLYILLIGGVCGLATSIMVGQGPSNSDQLEHGKPMPISRGISQQALAEKGIGFHRVVPNRVHWDGTEYDIDAGVPLLLSVITNSSTSHDIRLSALRRLGTLNTALYGRDEIIELIAIYPDLIELEARLSLLQCLVRSEDPRGFPLLYEAMQSDPNSRIRRLAATGLANWNVRSGIRTLIELIPSREPDGRRDVGTNVVMTLASLNRMKQLEIPIDAIEAPAKTMAPNNHDAAVLRLFEDWKAWYDQNQHRFSDWKPGDPLPDIEANRDVEPVVNNDR